MLGFGANLTGFNILNYLVRNVDNVLIARSWGAAPLGLYDRSYRLMMFPIQTINQPLSRLMLPALRRVRDDPVRYRRMFLLAIRTLSLISVPGIMAGAMCSREVVSILLGERWNDAGPIFFWLSLAAVTQPVSNATGWLFMSSDRSRAMMQWGLVSAPITITGFAAGLPWGAAGVATGYFLSQVICMPLLYAWSTRGTSVRASDLYATLLPTLVGGGIAWAVVGLLRGIADNLALVAHCPGECLFVQHRSTGDDGRRAGGDGRDTPPGSKPVGRSKSREAKQDVRVRLRRLSADAVGRGFHGLAH